MRALSDLPEITLDSDEYGIAWSFDTLPETITQFNQEVSSIHAGNSNITQKIFCFQEWKWEPQCFFEFFLFTVALQYTSASKSSFIIASYIIILPIVYLIIRRKKPTGSDVLASVICMVGICLLLANGLDSFNKGDLLSAGCALSYAVHIVYSSKFSKQYDGWLLNLTQMGTVAVLAWIDNTVQRKL